MAVITNTVAVPTIITGYDRRKEIDRIVRTGNTLGCLKDAVPEAIDWQRKERFSGCVLSQDTRTIQVMSDIWETEAYYRVWDGEKVIERIYGRSPEGDYVQNPVWPAILTDGLEVSFTGHHWSVDATEEVRALAEEWDAEQARLQALRNRVRRFCSEVERAIESETCLRRDADAVVVKGRKIKKGTLVRVTWLGESQYGPYANVIIASTGELQRYVAQENLEAVCCWDGRFKWTSDYGYGSVAEGCLERFAGGENLGWDVLCDWVGEQDEGDYAGLEFSILLQAARPE